MDSLPPGVDLSTIQVVPPPPGVTSNFVNPPSISWAPRLAVYLTFPPMVIVALLRLFVCLRSRQIGNDDCRLAVFTDNRDDVLIATRRPHSCCCKILSGTLIPESTLLKNTPRSALSHTTLFY